MKKILTLVLLCTIMSCGAKKLVYHDARQFPLLGSVVPVEEGYSRFPDSLKNQVKRELLYTLGTNTAGMSIRFSSDATALSAKWISTQELEMNHMTPVGIRGLDLYTLDDNNEWTFVSSVRPTVIEAWHNDSISRFTNAFDSIAHALILGIHNREPLKKRQELRFILYFKSCLFA